MGELFAWVSRAIYMPRPTPNQRLSSEPARFQRARERAAIWMQGFSPTKLTCCKTISQT